MADAASYEIRVVGALGPAGREAFADVSIDLEPSTTVLSGELSQADLHAVLDRVRALGLELVDVKQAPSSGIQSPDKDDPPVASSTDDDIDR